MSRPIKFLWIPAYIAGYGSRMPKPPQQPTVQELLEKIAQLENANSQLQAQISGMARDLGRGSRISREFDELLMKHCKHLDDVLEDVASRLKNVEYTVFPNLARDIVDLHNVIGGDGGAKPNPLDRRDPAAKPKSPKD